MKTTKLFSTVALMSVMAISLNSCKDKAETTTEDNTTMEDETSMDDMNPGDTMDEQTVMVGGAVMYPSKNIVENASQSADHKTLVAAVVAAELAETLSGAGPFTVFAPTDAAFAALPAGTVESLLKPENKKKLQGILTYHVVEGDVMAAAAMDMVKNANGKAMVKTVAGLELALTTENGNLYISDMSGNKAMVTTADVKQSNGVIHVIDKVLLPKM